MTISKELLDELLKGCERPEDLLGDAGLMKELKIKLMEWMLEAEPGLFNADYSYRYFSTLLVTAHPPLVEQGFAGGQLRY
jgi:hypothetical protein